MTCRQTLLRTALCWCAIGLALRVVLLLLAGETYLQKDEANYVYLALFWERFGFVGDAERFLWPPGWIWVLRVAFEAFGRAGLFATKAFEVAASLAIGAGTIGLAFRLSGKRAAQIAGALWAFHLPLAAYTHMLWTEPLFLAFLVPGAYLLVAAEQVPDGRRSDRRLFVAGLLFGCALLVKEAALFLVPLVCLGLLLARHEHSRRVGLRRAALLGLAASCVVIPWTVRNAEVYGRVVPVGTSMGENAYHGLNARYVNFDVSPLYRLPRVTEPIERRARPYFTTSDPAGKWERAEEIPNTAERSAEQLGRGLDWIGSHPGDFLRTRVQKLSNLVMPTSFFVRHQALELYEGALESAFVRRVTIAWSVLASMAILLLSVPGGWALFARRRETLGAWVPLLLALYFVATSLLVGMSRFRVPLLPCLFVFAGIFLALPAGERLAVRGVRVFTGGAWTALLFLWWLGWPELTAILELAWTR